MDIPSIYCLGLKISIYTQSELEQYIESCLLGNKRNIFYGYSIGLFPKLKNNLPLLNVCNSFDLMVTDGRIFYIYMKWLKVPLKYDISIPQLTIKVIDMANRFSKSVLLFGGTKRNNELATKNLDLKYTNAIFRKGIDGYQDLNEEQLIVENINKTKPDILLIGMHSPFKEEFAYRNKERLDCKIIIPCGGMIDVFAGNKKLTPTWIKKIGFAWLYRFVQNPVSRFKLTATYSYYFIFKLIPMLIKIRIFNKKYTKSIAEII